MGRCWAAGNNKMKIAERKKTWEKQRRDKVLYEVPAVGTAEGGLHGTEETWETWEMQEMGLALEGKTHYRSVQEEENGGGGDIESAAKSSQRAGTTDTYLSRPNGTPSTGSSGGDTRQER